MSAPRTTHGPWEFDAESSQIIAPKCGYQWSNGVCVVAEVTPLDYQESHGNGLVMAAALELLEAAQAAMLCIGELSPTQARVEVAQMLTAAIAKATGANP